jgi:hypothetical protein
MKPVHLTRKRRGFTRLWLMAACLLIGLTGTGGAKSGEDPQFEGLVVVGPDGNGWVAARFPTTADGDNVTFYLVIRPDERVKALGVTLNGEVVLLKASAFAEERHEVALHLVGTTDNEIMVSAEGVRGATAHFAIVALRNE